MVLETLEENISLLEFAGILLCCSTMDLQLKKAAEKPEKVYLKVPTVKFRLQMIHQEKKKKILSSSLWNLVYLQLEMCLDLGL